jgi:hypothetical protein
MVSFNQPRVTLVLEDGRTFQGRAFAGEGETLGEVVFNTAMTGYQEVLSDPSYKGQIVAMTYPLIGNYGVNDEDMESVAIQVEGFIVREYIPYPSNWRSQKTLKDFLEEAKILGVEGIDTRALTKHIRTAGAMKGIMATGDRRPEELLKKVQAYPGLVGRDLVSSVTTSSPYLWPGERRPLEWKPGMKGADVWPDSRHPYKVSYCPPRLNQLTSWPWNPMGFSCLTAREIPPALLTLSRRSAPFLTDCPYSASAWVTSSLVWPWEAALSNSNLDTAGATSQ